MIEKQNSAKHLENNVILVDASIYFFRYFYSPFATRSPVFTEDGYPIATAQAFGRWLIRLLSHTQSNMLAVCFDESLETCFRNDIYEGYKASREPADDAIIYEMSVCQSICHLLGLSTFASQTHEADDLIATLAQVSRDHGHTVSVVSSDKDLFQVLKSKDDVLVDFPEGEVFDRHGCYEKLGVWPGQVSDYLALVGDKADDVPGVPGVGAKGAARLLSAIYSLDHLWDKTSSNVANSKEINTHQANISQFKGVQNHLSLVSTLLPKPSRSIRESPLLATIVSKIAPHASQLEVSRRLTKLDAFAPLTVSTDDVEELDIELLDAMHYLNRGPADLEALEYFCEALNFTLPLEDLPSDLELVDYEDDLPAPDLRLIRGGLE